MTTGGLVSAQDSSPESTLYIPPSLDRGLNSPTASDPCSPTTTPTSTSTPRFLMWLTKIGTPSRTQCSPGLPKPSQTDSTSQYGRLTSTSSTTRRERYWNDFTTIRKEVRSFADGPTTDSDRSSTSRSDRAPTIPRPSEPTSQGPKHARRTLAHRWTVDHRVSAPHDEVLEFINGHTPRSSSVYTDLGTVSTYAHSRLTGAVPPGFNDLWKNRKPLSNTDNNTPAPGAKHLRRPPALEGDPRPRQVRRRRRHHPDHQRLQERLANGAPA